MLTKSDPRFPCRCGGTALALLFAFVAVHAEAPPVPPEAFGALPDKAVTYVKLDGEGHWLSNSNSRIALPVALDEFLKKHL